MKNLLKKSFILLLLLVMFPLSSFLVGCGATPETIAKTVYFVSDKYDEETGKAIFEVDLKVATELTYKCNPSSSESAVNFTIPIEGQTNSSLNRSRFTFDNGIITVNYEEFEEIEVKITVNGQTDQCIVRLKEYPVEVYPEESEVILNSYGSYTICAIGKFKQPDGTFVNKPLLEEEYNFTVVSDDETIVSVPNENRLTVCSERQNSASATVSVTLNDASGKPLGMTFKVKFTVVELAESGFLMFDGFDKFVEDGGRIVVDANVMTPNASGEYEISYKAFYISHFDTFVENTGNFEGSTTDSDYVSFDNENQIIKIKSSVDNTFNVTIWSDLVKPDGSSLGITFTVQFIAFDA